MKNARIPAYCLHKGTGQAYVRIGGRMLYLGEHGSKASKEAYGRAIAELAASPAKTACAVPVSDFTIVELAADYWDFAQRYYVTNGKRSGWLVHIKLMLDKLEALYGMTIAAEFGPAKFKAIRQTLIDAGQSRGYINKLMPIVTRVFKWGAAEELVPVTVYQTLKTVDGLRKGRSPARETAPVLPVDQAVVDATLPFLPPIVADMVKFQRLTGCRPGEVCQLRPIDVDRSGDVWVYRPASHKTAHHGKVRTIFIGPKAQDVIRKYLLRPADAFCFSPAETVAKHMEARHAARRTPLRQGNRPGSNRKRRPHRAAKAFYTKDSYARAIRRGVTKANRAIVEKSIKSGGKAENTKLLPYWHLNQLRHTAGTEIRKNHGLEAAQVVLGHSKADVTQVYAERDWKLGEEIMRRLG